MQRKIRGRASLGVAVAALGLGAAACGSSAASAASGGSGNTATGASQAGGKTIGLAIADQTSLFYIAEADGVKAAARKAGYSVLIESANDSGTTQVNQVNDLINHHVAAIVYTPTDASSATAGVLAANRAKIPVVGVDERPPANERSVAKEVSYIATNSVAAADQLCTWMAQQINGQGNIAIIEGVLGVTAQVQRSEGCAEALKNYPNIHVVAQQAANWMEDQAYTVASNILTGHPGLKAIFAESDAMALGTARAVQATHYPQPVIVSIDGFPSEITAIAAHQVSATEAQQPFKMGEIAVQNAISAIKGQTKGIPAVQYQKTYLINQSNVSQWTNVPAGSSLALYGPMGV